MKMHSKARLRRWALLHGLISFAFNPTILGLSINVISGLTPPAISKCVPMIPVESQNQNHLTVAQGYVELAIYPDANEELEPIAPKQRHLPDVLAIRVSVYGVKVWELMKSVVPCRSTCSLHRNGQAHSPGGRRAHSKGRRSPIQSGLL